MASYCTVSEYEAKWGTLSGTAEESRVTVMIEDVSLYIDALVESKGIDATSKAAALKALCRDYTHRVYENERNGSLSALTHQAGSFMETQSFRRLQDDFDAFARDYYNILGVSASQVCFAWPGDAS